ncbi:MAG: cytochrome C554 [Ignavibacteriales bacterium]|nr:cytochrome C554 [Ignavibacteriales bacterium]
MLKRVIAIALVIVLTYLVIPTNLFAQANGFEGTQVCGMCHKSEKQGQQLKIWQESKHAQAYKTLTTPEADKIAAEKGFKTKAVETKECLKCHASGYDVDKALIGAKFKVEDGVQCETCHGAGSAYKSMAVMKNREEAVKKGLKVYEDNSKLCVTCHNSESPTYKEFKFDEMWAKIAHKIPKG